MAEAEQKMLDVLDKTSLGDLLSKLNIDIKKNVIDRTVPFWGSNNNK